MRKDSINRGKSMLTGALVLAFGLGQGQNARAQDLPLSKRDSISYTINIDILHKQFLIAGDLYKIEKYKLQGRSNTNPDSLFKECTSAYQLIFKDIPDKRQQYFFSDKFYEEIIPVIQYFRNAPLINEFEEDRRKLHPKAAEPDPKHHESDKHDKH